jgi:ferric-dicitrate binding protein FerR (iron transport regulator)
VNCEQAANLISARIDAEILDADRDDLERHLATCDGCRATRDALAEQDNALDRTFAVRRQRAALVAERVIDAFKTGAPSPGPSMLYTRPSLWSRWGRPLLAAAAGFALAILVTRPWDKPATPTAVGPTTNQTITVAATRPAPVGQLALSTGAVMCCPSDSTNWRPLESGGAVEAGMKVRTGPKVRCEFKMADGSEVRLNSDTQVTLQTPRRVDVAGGQVFSSVRKQPPGETFVVMAEPAGATLTALGTAFDVSCSTKSATLTVVEGSVKMEAGGGENVVKGGETLSVADGRFGGKKQVENLMRATQWVDEILVLKGRDNAELARRIDDIFAQLGHDKMWYMNAQEVRRLGDHCVVPLARYIQSDRSKATQDDRMKRREAARIVADVATSWATPELINLLADDDADVRYAAARALQRLTGQNLGRTPEQWRDQSVMTCTPTIQQWHGWWDKNKSNIPGADPDAVKPIDVARGQPEPKGKG